MRDEASNPPNAEALGWTSLTAVADQIGSSLERAEAERVLEQAVHGLDTLSELALHTLLCDHLGQHFAVSREVHYPSTSGAKLSHRQRCDLVLSPKGSQLRVQNSPQLALPLPPEGAEAAPTLCSLSDALWLEVKVAYQFRAGGHEHKGYSTQFRKTVVADLRKLAAEPLIHHAAMLLIVFNETAKVATKDLDLFEALLMDKDSLAGARQVRSVMIQERIGHRLCSAALWPIIKHAQA